jgi:hypothetical protein
VILLGVFDADFRGVGSGKSEGFDATFAKKNAKVREGRRSGARL